MPEQYATDSNLRARIELHERLPTRRSTPRSRITCSFTSRTVSGRLPRSHACFGRAEPSARRRSASTTCADCASSSRRARGGQWERTRERFSIEQVPEELAPFFVDVEIEPYEDSLEVTELEPLLDFVRSRGDVEEHELERLRRAAEEEMASRGSFHVSKATARVRARKP